MEQLRTPLYEKLIFHKEAIPISLHVPGHKNGAVFPFEGAVSFKELLKLDVTELTGLDDLHSPEGVIRESEQLLAGLFGVCRSFFLVNGSTVGNLAMIMAALDEEDTVLVQRNCHKSILNGLQLVNADPVFISPEFDEDWQVAGGLSFEAVQAAIKKYPNAKALIVTYPNYYGMVYELGRIIRLAHGHNIPVLVDEAHGAHFIAGEPFPSSAVTFGADVVIQSAHKTLPAMTMGSFLHFNSKLIALNDIEKYLHILQSSSPSYPIMASLDIARCYLSSINKNDLVYLQEQINIFKIHLSNLSGIKVLSYPNNQGDLLKITIQSTNSLSGFNLQKILEGQGIFAELADPFNLLFIIPLLKEGMEYPFNEVIVRMKTALSDNAVPTKEMEKELVPYQKKDLAKLSLNYKEMKKRNNKRVPLLEAIGAISAEMIIPYPPGIPLLFPGEMIMEADIHHIQWLLEKGTRFQGGEILRQGFISIFI
ncbi:aminotransferase class I/II-fold pyridoxal phosphate-dependent enzyme [Bacillus sp. 1NLA3E]|uniref:aminotransferase class I/II-fold pyridoxal phosphate-dependent enzyme n=1 Tax=Bacillus sp. 1NLA3E TaxID=666686 RepID=UPI000247EF09|nr:aminotransferase class I/II-fold pyridoxal phosphate-dependent enzyme [Bacillus sp. 1NLA3E]